MNNLKLNISQKNFLYNIILTVLICTIIFSYMAFYMPNVYLEKKLDSAESNALSVHDSFVTNKNYDKINILAKDNMMSVFIPENSDNVTVCAMRFNATIRVKNPQIKNLIDFMKNGDNKNLTQKDVDSFVLKYIKPISQDLTKNLSSFVTIKKSKIISVKSNDTINFKRQKDNMILKFQSTEKDSTATNLVIMSKRDDGMYITMFPYIFNSISDIKSTVISAFPVIFLLIVFIVFLSNKFYSKSITKPIIDMTNFTIKSKNQKNANYDLRIHTNDEIEELSNNLKSLYETLTENYKTLEKNSKKKEIFIKSTSHELKTPLQTAILLNDSMITKIGKYKDTDKYLPELRDKLYKIQILIDDLMFMNKIDENPIMEKMDLAEIMRESVNNHSDLIVSKNLNVTVNGETTDVVDYDHFRIIFDNLLKNAIEYTENNGSIVCDFQGDITIKNSPTFVDESIIKKIAEPFVSSTKSKSKGIGMYIVDNLLEDMNYKMNLNYDGRTFSVHLVKNA